MSQASRVALRLFGALMLAVGAAWMGQGLNIIPGSFMTGNRTWFFIGLVVAALGLVLLVLGFRRHRENRAP